MQHLESILLQSIQENEGVLTFLRKVDEEIGTAPPARLLEFNESLVHLQEQASRTDKALLGYFIDQEPQGEMLQEPLRSLIEKREQIVGDILLLNEHLTQKASGVKSHLAHEMGKLRNGLSAMNGYRQQQNNQGRIVNRSS